MQPSISNGGTATVTKTKTMPNSSSMVTRDTGYFVLSGKGSLPEVITRKARRAAEENVAFVPTDKLFVA